MTVCSKCGLDIPTSECYKRAECQNCVVQRVRACCNSAKGRKRIYRYREREVVKAEVQLEVWQERIAAVPKDYHTLTEDEWDRVVEHFDGNCAFCQEVPFVYRGMFMTVDQGGRYCDWNMLPVCEQCLIRPKKNKNPFCFMNTASAYYGHKVYKHRRLHSKKKLKKIIQYLEPILLGAMDLDDTQQV